MQLKTKLAMKQYIDKSALVAEIEKRMKELQDLFKEGEKKLDSFQKTAIHLCIDECKVVLNILNTLEVKEVDLEKEIKTVYKSNRRYADKYNMLIVLNELQFSDIAEHFFELGLKAQTNIKMTNLDDIFIENGIDPNSKQAKIFKESYYTALEKLKAQKGR